MCTELPSLTGCEVHLVVKNTHLTSCRLVAKTLRSSNYRESDARRGRSPDFFLGHSPFSSQAATICFR